MRKKESLSDGQQAPTCMRRVLSKTIDSDCKMLEFIGSIPLITCVYKKLFALYGLQKSSSTAPGHLDPLEWVHFLNPGMRRTDANESGAHVTILLTEFFARHRFGNDFWLCVWTAFIYGWPYRSHSTLSNGCKISRRTLIRLCVTWTTQSKRTPRSTPQICFYVCGHPVLLNASAYTPGYAVIQPAPSLTFSAYEHITQDENRENQKRLGYLHHVHFSCCRCKIWMLQNTNVASGTHLYNALWFGEQVDFDLLKCATENQTKSPEVELNTNFSYLVVSLRYANGTWFLGSPLWRWSSIFGVHERKYLRKWRSLWFAFTPWNHFSGERCFQWKHDTVQNSLSDRRETLCIENGPALVAIFK